MAEGKPVVDASGKGLGVRGVPVNGVTDVDLDGDGRVVLNGKGMSVVPEWRDLPLFLIPRRLKDKRPGARSLSNETCCFSMGDGTITPTLDLKQDSETHGNVVPHQSIFLDQFQDDLAATGDLWTIDEA